MESNKSIFATKMEGNILDTSVDNLPYAVSHLDTIITLLASYEDYIVIGSLHVLLKLWQDNPANMKLFLEKGIVSKLEQSIQSDSVRILKLTLKLLIEAYSNQELIEKMNINPSLNFIKRLLCLYSEEEYFNEIIQEQCLYILLELAKSLQQRILIFDLGAPAAIFQVLRLTMDPDIQKYSLELFHFMLDVPDIEKFLSRKNLYSLKLLLCYLKNEFTQIQETAMKISIKLSTLKSVSSEAKLIEDGIITAMFAFIMDESKSSFHTAATTIINNTIDSKAVCEHFVQSQQFVQFIDFIKVCSEDSALLVAKVLNCITEYEDLLQILHDYKVEVILLHLFRFRNPKVLCHVCRTMVNLSNHKLMFEKLLSYFALKNLIDVSLIPGDECEFRIAALETVYTFMKRDNRTLHMLYNLDAIVQLQKKFRENAENLKNEEVEALLDVFYIFCSSLDYVNKMITEDFSVTLIRQVEVRNGNVAVMLLEIMNCFAISESFLRKFVYFYGPRTIVNKVVSTREEGVLRKILMFIFNTMMNKTVCIEYLSENLYLQLQKIPQRVHDALPIMKKVIDKMYDLYLPLKFYKTGRLEIEDKLETGFYILNGKWNEEFPFLDTLIKSKITEQYTAYIVDYTETVRIMRISCAANTIVTMKKRRGSFSRRSSSGSRRFNKRSSSGNHSLRRQRTVSKEPVLPPIDEISGASTAGYIVDKISTVLRYNVTSLDPFLADLVKICGSKLYETKKNVLCIQHKVKLVAKYIDEHASGFCPEITHNQFLYYHQKHISKIKSQLGSNIIPIGCVRHGGHVERSLLFKAIADKIGLPASLVRGDNEHMWNEVPMNVMARGRLQKHQKSITYGVVDLLMDVGKLMLVGSEEAKNYCKMNPILWHDNATRSSN